MAEEGNHCALVQMPAYDPATENDLRVDIVRPGTDKSYTVSLDADGKAALCLETAWAVGDVRSQEPVSIRIHWSNPTQTTVAQVDIDIYNAAGNPVSFLAGNAGQTVTWTIKKKVNSLHVGDMGVNSAQTDTKAVGVADWNPTRNHATASPWVITAAMSAQTQHFAYISTWYNSPLADARQPPAGMTWDIYVWYTLLGTYPGKDNPAGQHDWALWQSGSINPPAADYPVTYRLNGPMPVDPGLRMAVPNPTNSWTCGNPLGCLGPATANTEVTVDLQTKTSTKETDGQGLIFWIHQDDVWSTTSSTTDEVHISWGCLQNCV